jgi:2,4-dienoyl-CoA reductase-like NADH-dependent reductase (Old Yellow Enzyme family)/thioredoxin reductase
MTELQSLFSPLSLGSVEIPNRIVSTAHQTTLVHNHLPTDDFVAYHEARARGGVGMIIMEASAVVPSGLLTSHTVGAYLDDVSASFRRVADTVHEHGTKLFVQLFHGGREVIASAPKPVVIAPSAVPSRRYHVEPRALRDHEIDELIEGYAAGAARAAEGGLDGVEVTAAHNYLLEQFFGPANLRDDRWSESTAMLVAVLKAIRAAAPQLTLGLRLSADSDAARAAAPSLDGLVDYVHVAIGDSSTFLGCVGIVPPPPTPENEIARWVEGFRVGPPLIGTTRILDPRQANDLVASGAVDACGMNRALITDPDMPRKARAGDYDEILRCIGCNACIAHYHAETPIACAQNPRTGRERSLPRRQPAEHPKRVVVVGAGPAGLAAAAEAVAGGHSVVLLEQADVVGGQVAIAGRAPMHEELAHSLRRNYDRLLAGPSVEVRLGEAADADAVEALSPDLVIVATGAKPYDPRLPLDDVEVVQGWDVLRGNHPEGRVVVADWGGDATAVDCAEVLTAAGREVVLAVGSVTPAETLHQYTRNVYLGRLCRLGIETRHYYDVVSASGGEVRLQNVLAPELEATTPADAVVLSMGRVPEDSLTLALIERGLRVEEAGDCRTPRSIEEAILEGTLAAAALASPIEAAVV